MEKASPGTMVSIGLLVLRLGIGGYMITHGWVKLQMLLNDKAPAMDPIGIGPQLSFMLLVAAEFGCALLVILGLATRLAAIPLVFAMGVAAFVAHGNDPWTMSGDGSSKQPALMFLVPFLALVFTGPGKFALDHLILSRRRSGRSAKAD